MKKLWFPLCMLLLFLFCISHPAEAIPGAAAGLSLWYCTVLPTLLPCIVLSSYLISTELVKKLPPGPFAFVIGWFCGYPMGAKAIADLYKTGRLSREDGNLLLILCCEPSPMFLTGFLCTGMLHLPILQVLPCLIAIYLPPVLCYGAAMAVRHRKPGTSRHYAPTDTERSDSLPENERSGGILASFLRFEGAMMDGFLVIAKIGGYLMFFTMLSYFFRDRCPIPLLNTLVPGLLEMTSGIAFTVQSGLSRTLVVALCFTYTAFGGLSGLAQTASVLGRTPLSKRSYLFWKLLQASMTFAILFLLFPFLQA
ncbi:hypothetical protein LQE92_00535 [Lacrimispora sp. NSJ-141]|uniref:Sporulation integral membrane protein YlbJ n=1 Tax=Lientehia hominis TaxID=2897778 RepID=A0AAP2W7J3_9FIRM|nr:hypothetical protein [Lientehia hominis]MCD2491110.1 hypothetical protein [Lientehia hominis]